jgi:two-component system NarL family sensor kinase
MPTTAPVQPSHLQPVVLADGRGAGRRTAAASPSVLWRFGLATALALAVVVVAGLVLSARAAEHEVIADVSHRTALIASAVVEPQLSTALLRGDPAAIAAMDRLVGTRLTAGTTDIVRVKIWDAEGCIVYSDAHRLIGVNYPLEAEEREVVGAGGTSAQVSDLRLPENRMERAFGDRLLEVYTHLPGPDGSPLLLEAYYSYGDVNARRSELLWSFASITLLGLLIFAGLVVSIGLTMVGWLRRERDRLLDKAIKVSDGDRRRLAADLHDGVVQDLAGASYALAGTAAEMHQRGDEDLAAGLTGPGDIIRASIRALRSMIVELYPATLRTEGLENALTDLAESVRLRGIDVQVTMLEQRALPEHAQVVIYRTAQEALRNVANHSGAGHAAVTVTRHGSRVRVEVADDGVGFDPGEPADKGHIGLLSMAELAEQSRGLLELVSAPGHGTLLRLELPT